MSTELTTTSRNGAQVPSLVTTATSSIAEVKQYAELFFQSGLFSDTKSVAQAAVKIMAGRELGMGPFESMRDISIIQGKTAIGAANIGARIKKTGVYDYQIIKFDAEGAVLRFTKYGKALSPDISFTIEDAKRLQLAGKDNYTKQARTMLFWRAVTMGARMHCPEVFGGAIYTPEELRGGVERDEPADVPVDAEFSDAPAPVVTVAATGEPVAVPTPSAAPAPVKALPNPWLHKLEITNGEDGQPTWADGRGKYLCEVDLDTLKIVAQQFPHRLTPSDGVNLKAAFRTIKDKTHESLIERAYQEIADELPEVGTHSADAEGPAPEVE